MDVMVCRTSSLVFTACEFISKDRCVVIRSINSVTGSTLDVSSVFCCVVPTPFWPGLLKVAVPEESVSAYRFSPRFSRPWGLTNVASSIWPTWLELLVVGLADGDDPFGTDHDGRGIGGNR